MLAQRPGYRLALHAQQLLVSDLGGMYLTELDPLASLADLRRSEQISLTLLKFDPGNMVTINNLSVARNVLGDASYEGAMADIFLSYSRKDLARVMSLAEALQSGRLLGSEYRERVRGVELAQPFLILQR